MRAPSTDIHRARELRGKMTPPEVRLWVRLRGDPHGLRFRRQHAPAGYVLDFYCAAARLAVEVDGYAHGVGDRPERDARRDSALAELGVETLWLSAAYVLADPGSAAQTAIAAALARVAAPPPSASPPPPPQAEGGES